MENNKRDFDKEAITWDDNPGRIKMTESIFNSIKTNIDLKQEMEAMDFGCGTGLLSLKLLPYVEKITAIDSSDGMLNVLDQKIRNQSLSGIKTLNIDIDKGDLLTGEFDLITSSMAMHHIKDIIQLINQFYNILKPGGYLCIADLDPDRGLFHENNEGVFHEGFSRDIMKQIFADAGFVEINDYTATKISKPDKNGNINNFSIFLLTGKK